MDHPDGVANLNGKPVFDARAFDRLVSGPIMGLWSSLRLLGALLHVGGSHRPPLHQEQDS